MALRSDGRILDPSVWAGMKSKAEPRGIRGAIQRALNVNGGALGVRRWQGKFAARCDLPVDGDEDFWMSGFAVHPNPAEAIDGAIGTALMVGDNSDSADEESFLRAWTLRNLIQGADPYEVEAELAHQNASMGFFPAMAALAPSVLPMASGLLSKVPGLSSIMPGGGGGGKAAAAPSGAMPSAPPSIAPVPGGAPITVTPYGGAPGGPVIVRF